MKFVFDGCDISFIVEAPEDITLKELLKQADRLVPDWCACGCDEEELNTPTDVYIEKDSISLAENIRLNAPFNLSVFDDLIDLLNRSENKQITLRLGRDDFGTCVLYADDYSGTYIEYKSIQNRGKKSTHSFA